MYLTRSRYWSINEILWQRGWFDTTINAACVLFGFLGDTYTEVTAMIYPAVTPESSWCPSCASVPTIWYLYIGKYYYRHLLWYFSCHMYNCWKLLIMSTYLSWMWTHRGILVYWTRFGNLPNRQVRGTWAEPTSYIEVKLKLLNFPSYKFC